MCLLQKFILSICLFFYCQIALVQGRDIYNQTALGSICRAQDTNEMGFCKRPEDCVINNEFVPEKNISTCFSDDEGPVICCTDPPQRISEQKCLNFHLPKNAYFRHQEIIKNETITQTYYGASSSSFPNTSPKIEFRELAAIGWLVDGTTDQIDFKCGGTLIDRHYVVTAAHCMATQPYLVRLGGVNISNKTVHPDDIIVTEHYIHPNYTSQSVYNDIAILKLNKDAITWDSVPACLWTDKNVNFTTLVATGYGQTSFAGPTTDDLIKVNLKYFGNSVCNGIFDDGDSRYANGIVDSQLCAGLEQGKQDTCPGDSGGPIGVKIVQTNAEKTEEIFYLIGVTSFGSGCGGADAAVYTRISSFLDWIESIVWYVR